MRFHNRTVGLAVSSLLLSAAIGSALPAVAQTEKVEISKVQPQKTAPAKITPQKAPAPKLVMPKVSPPVTVAPGDHAAKVAVGIQIFTTLPVIRLVILGAQKGIRESQDPELAGLSPVDRERLGVLVGEEIQARGPEIINAMAQTNVDRFTVAQLDDILTISKIKLFQDSMLAAADSNLVPGNDVVTPAEREFMVKASHMPYIDDFFRHMTMDATTPIIAEAARAGARRFVAEKSGQPG